jgi:NAD+ kinase
MQTKFKTIGILGKPSDPDISDTLTVLYHFLSKNHTVLIDSHSAQFITEAKSSDIDDFGQNCDLVIAVGGDGTFLAAARAIASFDIPLIGINLGRLGFLVDISPDQMVENLSAILGGEYDQEQRSLLHAQIIRGNKIFHEQTAVNEVVVHRWVTPSMIEITTKINGVFLNTQRSDGLIISTPTGSTAYALSAGGPILHPVLHALVLVPLNPHTFSNRPIVIEDNAEIEITFSQTREINALVTCDHLEIPGVVITDKIVIKKAPKPITILHPKGHDFFNTLRNKLNWSSGYNA